MTGSPQSPVPAEGHEPGPFRAQGSAAGCGGLPPVAPAGAGLQFSVELDLVSALEALGRPLRDNWGGVDQEEDLAAELADRGFTDVPPGPGRMMPGPGDVPPGPASVLPASVPPTSVPLASVPPTSVPPGPASIPAGPRSPAEAPVRAPGSARDLAGAIAEVLPTGPGLAAWLAGQDPATAAGGDLVGMAGAFRRLASWAQARELALIAHVTARSAAADPKAGLAADGRPAFVTDDAAAQVSLELALSRPGAEAWAGLAVALQWRLPRTAAALADGQIDTYRARILAEAVVPLSDAAAKAVEDQVIPRAGDLTYGQVHSAVRRAVIAADPDGAEHRRQAAERRARVSLYPDQDHTASLTGARLPAPEATASFARICAMASAMKAAGAAGGIDFLRSQVFIGLLLGTLSPIPPPPGAPPDADPPPDDVDDGWTPGAPGEPPHDHSTGPAGSGTPNGGSGPRDDRRPEPSGGLSGADCPSGGTRASGDTRASGTARPSRSEHDTGPAPAADRWPGDPPLTDAGLPADDRYRGTGSLWPDSSGDWNPARGDPLDDHFASPGIQWPWPPMPSVIPAAPGSTAPAGGTATTGTPGRPPPGGLLDLTLPWVTFTGAADAPGTLGRLGPVTAPEARRVASLALQNPAAQWRVILTGPDACAIAVTRVPAGRRAAGRRDPPGAPDGTGTPKAAGTRQSAETAGVVGRVTIVLPAGDLDTAPACNPRRPDGIYARLLAAARRARDNAWQEAEADRRVPGGCAHTTASPAYRPPPRIREYVAARDQTCRGPGCGQPAWRGDLDHTVPWDQGGPTCPCDLGALCRRHHRLKQHPGWTVLQPQPGIFRWTTPAGRTYTTRPDPHYAG
jgi:Domain of unknown function (DUF222)